MSGPTRADVKIASIRAHLLEQERRLTRIENKLDAALAGRGGLSLPQTTGVSALVSALIEIVQRIV